MSQGFISAEESAEQFFGEVKTSSRCNWCGRVGGDHDDDCYCGKPFVTLGEYERRREMAKWEEKERRANWNRIFRGRIDNVACDEESI